MGDRRWLVWKRRRDATWCCSRAFRMMIRVSGHLLAEQGSAGSDDWMANECALMGVISLIDGGFDYDETRLVGSWDDDCYADIQLRTERLLAQISNEWLNTSFHQLSIIEYSDSLSCTLKFFRFQIANVHANRLRSWHILFACAAPIILTLQNDAILFGNLCGLIIAAVHEVLEVDFRAFEPLPCVDKPPNQNEELRSC